METNLKRVASKGDDKARDDLEDALGDIRAAAQTLMAMGEHPGVVEANAVAYVGGAVLDHYDAAQDAFRRLYGLDEYGAPSASGSGEGGSDLLKLWSEFLDILSRSDAAEVLEAKRNMSDEELTAANGEVSDRTFGIFERMLDTPANGLLDIQAKVHAACHLTGKLYGNYHSDLSRDWEMTILADLERLTGQKLPRYEAEERTAA